MIYQRKLFSKWVRSCFMGRSPSLAPGGRNNDDNSRPLSSRADAYRAIVQRAYAGRNGRPGWGIVVVARPGRRAVRTIPGPVTVSDVPTEPEPGPLPLAKTPIRVSGTMPAELWNRFGTRVLPKLRAGEGLKIVIDLTATFDGNAAKDAKSDLSQVLRDLGLDGSITIE